MPILQLPIKYRSREIGQILSWLEAGDSCQMFGIGSVGKSNVLRHLQRSDVMQYHLPETYDKYLLTYIDANKLSELSGPESIARSAFLFYELILNQILLELTGRGVESHVLDEVGELYDRLISPENRPFAIRYLERSIALVSKRLGFRLVLLIDDLHLLVQMLPGSAFVALRALRDEFKYQLMFVGATRRPLVGRGGIPSEIEPFSELLSGNTLWLSSYSEQDARIMLRRFSARHNPEPPETEIQAILELSGRHPGLIQAIYKVRHQYPGATGEFLLTSPGVEDECRRIWDSIPTQQQEALLALVFNPNFQYPDEDFALLDRMGLWQGGWDHTGRIFSPILHDFLVRMLPSDRAHILLDSLRRLVWVDGKEIDDLPPLEFKMLEYLVQNRGKVCSRDELARYLYPEDMSLKGEGVSDDRLASVAKRLRDKIEPDQNKTTYIFTKRGAGFQLIDGAPEA